MEITREQVEVVLDALAGSSYASNWQHCIEHPDLADECFNRITEICNTPPAPSGPDFTPDQKRRLARLKRNITPQRERVFQIDTGYACGGIVIVDDVCTDAPSIYRWMVGKRLEEIMRWARIKTLTEIPPTTPRGIE